MALLKGLRPSHLILSDIWAEISDERYVVSNGQLVGGRFADEIKAGKFDVHKEQNVDQIKRMGDTTFDMFYLDMDAGFCTGRTCTLV